MINEVPKNEYPWSKFGPNGLTLIYAKKKVGVNYHQGT